MSIASLSGVLKIFGGSDPSDEEREALAQEVMLMVLARATAADSNIKSIEVETVRAILERYTGRDFEPAEIRVAANSQMFEKAPLPKYVASAGKKLNIQERVAITDALSEVIRSDERISSREVNFFNDIAAALQLTAADVLGLIED